MRYSPSTGGFYLPEIHGDAIPADAVVVSQAEYDALMQGQSAGQQIRPGAGGHPELQDHDAPDIEFFRARASLPKFEFLRQCVLAGLLTEADALSAARGDIPAAFAPVVAGWSEAERFEAELRWASLSQVDRMHPLIIAVADQAGVTIEQLDQLFGINTGT